MIKFEDIAFGDLLYLEAGEYNAEEWLDASNDAIAKVRIALRAVRGKPA